MNTETFSNLSGAINYKFPGKSNFFEVHQSYDGIVLAIWDVDKMGQSRPDEATMLTWATEYETALPALTKQVEITRLEDDLVEARARNLAVTELVSEGKLDSATKWEEKEAAIVAELEAE